MTWRRCAISAGPALGAGLGSLVAPGGGHLASCACWSAAAALAVVAADASRMSKAEVERIWLPFVPWLLLVDRLPARSGGAGRCSGCRCVVALLRAAPGAHQLVSQARSGSVAKRARPSSGPISAVNPSSALRPLRRRDDVPHVAEPVAAGDRRASGPSPATSAGDVEDRDRATRSRRCTPSRRRVGASTTASQRQQVGPGDVVDVDEVAHLAAVLEDPRRLAALERGAEHRRDPAVRRVPGHPGAVDVVVAQGDRRAAGLAGPGRRVVLLGQLAGGVAAARVEPGVLLDQVPAERRRRRRGQVFSNRPACQVGLGPRARAAGGPCRGQA